MSACLTVSNCSVMCAFLTDFSKGGTIPDEMYLINLGFVLTLILQITSALVYQLLSIAIKRSKSGVGGDLSESLSFRTCLVYYSIFLILKMINPSMHPVHWLILSGSYRSARILIIILNELYATCICIIIMHNVTRINFVMHSLCRYTSSSCTCIYNTIMHSVIQIVDYLRSLSVLWKALANKQDLVEKLHYVDTKVQVVIMTKLQGTWVLAVAKTVLDVALSVAASVILSLLLISGDVEENPGPIGGIINMLHCLTII